MADYLKARFTSLGIAVKSVDVKELEKVTEKIGTISVCSDLDAVLNDLVRMKQ